MIVLFSEHLFFLLIVNSFCYKLLYPVDYRMTKMVLLVDIRMTHKKTYVIIIYFE